ncbi:hypothetical protein ACT2FY_08435 [Paraburkholderia fungorum]|uniref:hypothetical protein n=1 Tax=Paraburkholderia fungorum TaxID=134537 RepID=UPI00402B2E8A
MNLSNTAGAPPDDDPLAVSNRALNFGVAAADLVARLTGLLDELSAERLVLRSLGLSESDSRIVALARDYAYTQVVIETTSKSLTEAWTRLHTPPKP